MTITLQDTKEFYHENAEEIALQNCVDEGYQPLFMPQLVDVRINGLADWMRDFITPSVKVTGRTKQGHTVVVYAHVPTSLATPEGIRQAKA